MGFVSVSLVLVGPPRAVWVVLLRCSAFVLLPALPYRLEVLAPVGHGGIGLAPLVIMSTPLVPWSLVVWSGPVGLRPASAHRQRT